MIKEKTVFILGAGDSCPYGYPDGRGLRQKICSKFVNDSTEYFNAQGEREGQHFAAIEKHEVEQFAETFHKSSTRSIDLFLARNPEFKLMGKWAIIFRILTAEQTSQFRENIHQYKKPS
jgi:hypothetical protein